MSVLAPDPAPPLVSAPAAPRAHALDALRGIAILLMVLSGLVPYGVLPAWMYHAQVPPPAHTFDPSIPGITWVDLVFPFFLFALGAAIPLALGRRLARGASLAGLVRDLAARGGLLLVFGIFLQHVRPGVIGGEGPWKWIAALLGFACMWGMFLRLPGAWPRWARLAVRTAGWTGALALLATLRYPDGSGFRLGRFDIIIVLLAGMAFLGGLVWLATRARPGARFGVLAVLAAAILAGREPGWVQPFMDATVAEGLFRPYYLKYLFIVLPGTFAGEWLAAWMRASEAGDAVPRALSLAVLGWALQGVVVVGLFVRETALTAFVALGLCGLALVLLRAARTPTGTLVRTLWAWGAFWLLLGLVAEPFEGGIRKDASTFSYYFVTVGLALPLLASLTLGLQRHRPGLLVANGQNPMVAYVAAANGLLPLLALAGLLAPLETLTAQPWIGALRGLAYTLAVAAFVAWTTRRGWFWRT